MIAGLRPLAPIAGDWKRPDACGWPDKTGDNHWNGSCLIRLCSFWLAPAGQFLARTWSNAPAHARRTRALDQKITAARVLLERSGTTHAKCPNLTGGGESSYQRTTVKT